ncbi:hypothetical protein F5888DRAFT_1638433 [Russula emetica]|nr:hypothetical protein F5888DRAFT_1638433 [Russula emetica]
MKSFKTRDNNSRIVGEMDSANNTSRQGDHRINPPRINAIHGLPYVQIDPGNTFLTVLRALATHGRAPVDASDLAGAFRIHYFLAYIWTTPHMSHINSTYLFVLWIKRAKRSTVEPPPSYALFFLRMHNLHIVTTSAVPYGYSADALWFFNTRKTPFRWDATGHCINYYNTLVANIYFYNNLGTGRVLSRREAQAQKPFHRNVGLLFLAGLELYWQSMPTPISQIKPPPKQEQ